MALTADESKNKKVKGLKGLKSLSQQKPQMLLSTYYIMSQLAMKAVEGSHFDYIIIEEASQAFLATIALAKKLGKKCIIIGDIKQLEPIFHKQYAEPDPHHFHWMVCGLKAISYYLPNARQYILTDSYRLTPNSVRSTNAFYDGRLISMSNAPLPLDFSNLPLLQKHFNMHGGPSLRMFDLPDGKVPSEDCMRFIIDSINELKKMNSQTEIAVLAFNRDSVRYLQKEIFSKCLNVEQILVETIDRVQGLTTDFCFFFIPIESYPAALQANRFNVATSRARLCTLLITDYSINHFALAVKEVNDYLASIECI